MFNNIICFKCENNYFDDIEFNNTNILYKILQNVVYKNSF